MHWCHTVLFKGQFHSNHRVRKMHTGLWDQRRIARDGALTKRSSWGNVDSRMQPQGRFRDPKMVDPTRTFVLPKEMASS